MNDVQISQDVIASLGAKLAALENTLSNEERALVVAILSIAADAISRESSPVVERIPPQAAPFAVGVEGDLPSIGDMFAGTFTPGAADGFAVATFKVDGGS